MMDFLSNLNRARLFKRDERKRNDFAVQRTKTLVPEERKTILDILAMFAPHDCGVPLRRVGGANDGGYLVPDDLDGIAAMFSPGVSDTITFDREISDMGIPCFLADGTVNSPPDMPDNMKFSRFMIGDGGKAGFKTMSDWIAETRVRDGDLIMQMDIEGAEFDVVTGMPDELIGRFRIMLIELHNIDKMLLGEGRNILQRFMLRLLTQHHVCHVHPNNICAPVDILGRKVPPFVELTLLRSDRVRTDELRSAVYPNPSDRPNITSLPNRDYPAFW